jgi:MFS family permease
MDAAGVVPGPSVRPRHALWAVCVAMAVVGVNTTAVGVATRGIADGLGATIGQLEWIMGAYLITAAAFALTGGRMGDVVGRARTLLIGIVVMIGGSALAGVAPGAGVLIAGRAVQGIGAALIMPASIEVLAAHAPPTGARAGFRARGVAYAVAFGVGPLLGGVLTDGVSWRAVFGGEVLVLSVAAYLSLPLLRATSWFPRVPTRDFLGAGLAAALVFAVVLGASRSRVWGWWSWPMAALAVLVAGLGAWLVRVESRTVHPLLHRGLLRDRGVLGANVATLAASIGMVGLIYFFGLFALSASTFDSTPLAVAFSLVPFTLSVVAFSLIARFLARHLGLVAPVLVGLGLSVLGFALLSRVTTATTEAQLVVPLILCGVGAGIANAGLIVPAVMTDLRRVDEAAGLLSLTRYLGSALAIALGTASYLTVAVAGTPATGGESAEAGAVGGAAYARAVATLRADLRRPFEEAARSHTVEAFAATMRLAAVVVAVLAFASALLLSSRRPRPAQGPAGPLDPPIDRPGDGDPGPVGTAP